MISAILLSGGIGKRMQSTLPKQYLPLNGKPVILHALEALLSYPNWAEIAVVCEEEYKYLFLPYTKKARIHFALPGKERQDSVFSGLSTFSPKTKWVCIHDGARPLLLEKDLLSVIAEGMKIGASALAVPIKTTIKEVDDKKMVKKTLDRTLLWELQTPQVLTYSVAQEGHQKLTQENKVVTDDVSLAEFLGYPVKLVSGSYSNIKITTSEDLLLADLLLKRIHG
jgi:2-C-methyl-D-erythritol 4-phosphate cytidylyltransferase